jgi:hypothetical protein
LRTAMTQTFRLSLLTVLIAVPSGRSSRSGSTAGAGARRAWRTSACCSRS